MDAHLQEAKTTMLTAVTENVYEGAETTRVPKATSLIEPLMVGADEAARLCGIGRSTWFRLKSAGKTPKALRLGGRSLYSVADLKLWVTLGCPARKEFEARKAATFGR